MMTGKAVSTLTPESSEAPRESLAGEVRTAWLDESATLKPEHVDYLLKGNALYQSTKTSSPELASLAASYVALDETQLSTRLQSSRTNPQVVREVRSLAASVLAQAEGTPRK